MTQFRGALLLCLISSIPVAAQDAHNHVQFNTAGAGARQTDIEAAVKLICPASRIVRGKDGHVSGCGVCPKGTDFFGQTQSQWEMYAETPGHLTSGKADNLLVDGTGCDAHVNNFGGSFLFALAAGKVRLLRYEKGLITDQCQKFAYADGRDGLLCRGGYFAQGEADQVVLVVSFAATGTPTSRTLLHVHDTTATCGGDVSQRVEQGEISGIEFIPKPGGGPGQIDGLILRAELGSVKCAKVGSTQKTKSAPPSVKSYSIKFEFDGKEFRVAPESRAAMSRFTSR